MTTQATATYDEPCPGCDQTDSVRWVTSTPETDTWVCRRCDTDWTITVELSRVPR